MHDIYAPRQWAVTASALRLIRPRQDRDSAWEGDKALECISQQGQVIKIRFRLIYVKENRGICLCLWVNRLQVRFNMCLFVALNTNLAFSSCAFLHTTSHYLNNFPYSGDSECPKPTFCLERTQMPPPRLSLHSLGGGGVPLVSHYSFPIRVYIPFICRLFERISFIPECSLQPTKVTFVHIVGS